MTEEHDDGAETPATGRSTAPQSPFEMREVGIGLAVLLVGIVVAFAVPLFATAL